jgi:hypothetical protein
VKLRLRRSEPHNSPQAVADIYYASDVHGSDVCWRKFLGAARFYGAQSLIMGGDLTGKAIVPIAMEPGGRFTATFLGETRSGTTPDQLADDRLEDLGAELFIIAGNDDPWSVDDVLRAAARVRYCDDQVVSVASHEMISLSYSNPTPGAARESSTRRVAIRDFGPWQTSSSSPKPRSSISMFRRMTRSSIGLSRSRPTSPYVYRGQPVEIPVGSHAVGRSSMRCNRCSRSTATSTSLAAALASGARSRSTPALSMGPVACMGSACGSQMTVWFHTSFLSDSTGRST